MGKYGEHNHSDIYPIRSSSHIQSPLFDNAHPPMEILYKRGKLYQRYAPRKIENYALSCCFVLLDARHVTVGDIRQHLTDLDVQLWVHNGKNNSESKLLLFTQT